MLRPLYLLLPLITSVAVAQQGDDGAIWRSDFAKAKAEAKTKKKDLLVDFTGSDWCSWCIRLDQEVFDRDEFKMQAPQHFVLVKLDFPNDENLVTAELRAQNEQLQKQYSIQGFPTILLMDADGLVYAQTGYQRGGPEPYLEQLAALRKKGEAFKTAMAQAATRKGKERAAALDAALSGLDEEVAGNYHFDLMKEIMDLDADGKAGIREKYTAKVQKIEEEREISAAAAELNELVGEHMQSGEGDEALAKIEAVIKAPKTKMRHQMALFFKGMIIMDTSGDAAKAIEALELGKALAPDSPIGQRIAQVLPELKKQAEKDGD